MALKRKKCGALVKMAKISSKWKKSGSKWKKSGTIVKMSQDNKNVAHS